MRGADIFRDAPKAIDSFDRCVSLDQTLVTLPLLRAHAGITRLAEITYLDRIGIPVMSAVVPDSHDMISVYNGKGPTREAALVGAVMEAIERTQGAQMPAETQTVDARDAGLISPGELGAHRQWQGTQFEAVSAFDIVAEERVFVPAAAVYCPWRGTPVLHYTSTNGLAAGNTLAEAILHALYELIERHLWSITHAEAHLRPRAIVSAFAGGPLALPTFTDDPVAIEITLPTGVPLLDDLIRRIRACGLTFHLRCVERPPLPILFSAAIGDEDADIAHFGLGCSWSPTHAALRAITEAAQSRASDFQAAREDLLLPNDPRPTHGDHNRRTAGLPNGRWDYDAPTRRRGIHTFADYSTSDVGADLARLVSAFRENALGRIAVVDLSPAGLPVHVVRAIAPGLETAMVDGRIGPAIAEILNLNRHPKARSVPAHRPPRKRAS